MCIREKRPKYWLLEVGACKNDQCKTVNCIGNLETIGIRFQSSFKKSTNLKVCVFIIHFLMVDRTSCYEV